MQHLNLGGVKLPIDILTSTLAVLGTRGVGKTNTGAVIAEEAIRIGVPIAAVDRTGAWWGLKSSADGKSAGLPVYVFGGEHADVPIEPEAGAFVGKFLVEKRVPTVCDLSLMRKGRAVHFVRELLEEVYHHNREPLFTIIDEAAQFIPQMMFGSRDNPDIAGCIGAVEDIGMLGRRRGLGCAIIGQRASTINKNALEQCHTLIVHQTVGPNDRARIDEWIGLKFGKGAQRDEFLAALPELKKGEAFIWSPEFGIFTRAQIRQRETFDSGATPKIGQRAPTARVFASVDIAALTSDLAALKARADENDPKLLHARIADLQKQLGARPEAAPERIEVPVLTDIDRITLNSIVQALQTWDPVGRVPQAFKDLREQADALLAEVRERVSKIATAGAPTEVAPNKVIVSAKPRPIMDDETAARIGRAAAEAPSNGKLGEGERKILTAIVQLREPGMTREHLTLVTGYKRSTRNAYIQRLRQAGYVLEEGDRLLPTPHALDALGEFNPLPTGPDLRRYWLRQLPVGEALVLERLIDAYPRAVDRETISTETRFKRSTRNAYIQRLATRELVQLAGDGVKASDKLFEGAPA